MELLLFFVGLGFFLFVIWIILNSEEERYNRKLNERREFGYQKQKRQIQKDIDKLL